MYSKVMRWVNTGCYVAMIAVNALANIIPLGGKNTGQVSEGYPSLFTPAPVTFAIWGLIYLMMGIFVIGQWGVGIFRNSGDKYRDAVGPFFAISCLLNIGWIFSWHFEAIGLSVILMSVLLLSLFLTNILASSVEAENPEKTVMTAGLDIYLGWIVAAFIANICVFLSQFDSDVLIFNNMFYTISAVIISTVIASMIELITGKWMTASVVIWAFIGILIRHIGPSGYAGAYPVIISVVIAGMFVILISIIFRTLGNKFFCRKGENV